MQAEARSQLMAGTLHAPDASKLLRETGFESMRLRAGYIAHTQRDMPFQPAPVDTRPLCSPAAQIHLILMLEGYQRQLLGEWLRQMVHRRERAPEQLVPALLEAGYRRNPLRPAIKRFVGKRGTWLQELASREHWEWLNQTTRSLSSQARPGVEQQQQALCDGIRQQGLTRPVLRALSVHEEHWGDELMRAFFGALQDNLEHGFRVNEGLRRWMNRSLITCASFIPLSYAGDYAGAIGVCIQDFARDDMRSLWQKWLYDICETLEFRQQMHQAIHSNPSTTQNRAQEP